jgi:predicted nucleic acid-binding protein
MPARSPLLDTNVIVRYLVEDPERVPVPFRGVFTFFPKVESGEVTVELPELVLFEAFYVLTRLYHVPQREAARTLAAVVAFQGLIMRDKSLIHACLHTLQTHPLGLVDAYLLALAKKRRIRRIYSFDKELARHGMQLLPFVTE